MKRKDTGILGEKLAKDFLKKKGYRIKEIDTKVRDFRTAHEAQLLHEAKVAGVPTPSIYFVNRAGTEIIMEHIEGTRLKDCVDEVDLTRLARICFHLGRLIAALHRHGIIHGDLTTSNVVVTPSGEMFLLDFGLGFYSNDIEAKGVDLHLLKQVFESFHVEQAKSSFKAILEGYEAVAGGEQTAEVREKIREIESRGRYIPASARGVR